MRYLLILLLCFAFAACNSGSQQSTLSTTESSAPPVHSEMQNPPLDSVENFLITSAATDFHTHGPAGPLHFQNVRLGHIVKEDGGNQYVLCGQFQPVKDGDKTRWTSFSTIKTSGYEQYIGGQSVSFCEDTAAVWDKKDLSEVLKNRLKEL